MRRKTFSDNCRERRNLCKPINSLGRNSKNCSASRKAAVSGEIKEEQEGTSYGGFVQSRALTPWRQWCGPYIERPGASWRHCDISWAWRRPLLFRLAKRGRRVRIRWAIFIFRNVGDANCTGEYGHDPIINLKSDRRLVSVVVSRGNAL